MSETKDLKNPFPDLRPFERDEYPLFFGREGQSDALLERLERARFLAVVGTSGSGKSSLVRAGLLPALQGGMMAGAGAGWRVAVMRPGHDPVGNLARVLAEDGVFAQLGAGLERAEAEAIIEATLRRGSLGLVDLARQARLSEREKLLVVVDQFEELFRFRAAHAATDAGDDAAAFVKLLLEARQTDKEPQERVPIYVVLTMRSDFLGDCAQFQGLPEAVNDGQYLIPRMTRDERRLAIAGPVRVMRGKITEPLVNRLLNDVGDNPDQLPILQHALMRTWDFWTRERRYSEPLNIEHYTAIGTMTDALSRHAEEAFGELRDERIRRIAEKMFKALTERGTDNRETRRPTRLAEICAVAEATEEEVVAIVEVFRREGRSFLMPPVGITLTPETVIDISHESLIRNWARLKEWTGEEAQSARIYRRLAEAAVLHREGKEGLPNDPALQIALDWRDATHPNPAWAARYHPEFDQSIAYLDTSRDARTARLAAEREREQAELTRTRAFADQQARANRKLRLMMAALAVVLLLAVGTAVYALNARADAERSRKKAEGSERAAIAAKEDAVTQKRVAEEKTREAETQKSIADEKTRIAEEKTAETVKANEKTQIALDQARAETERANASAARLQKEFNFSHKSRDAVASFRRGDMQVALKRFQNLLPMAQGDPVKLGWVHSNIGATQRQLGQYELGSASYIKAKALQEQAMSKGKLAKGDPEYIDTLNGFAQLHSDRGDYAKAEPLYQQALDVRKSVLGREHAEVATGLEDLAANYYDQGEYDKAKERYEEALAIRRKKPESPDLIKALATAADFYAAAFTSETDTSGPETAKKMYKEILSIQEKKLEPNDPNIAEIYSNLVLLYHDISEYGYKELNERLNALAQKIRSRNRDFNYYADLAQKYIELRKYPQAKRLLNHAEGVYQAPDMASSSERAEDVISLAELYRKVNDFDDAKDAYERALEHSSGDARTKIRARKGLARVYAEHGKDAEAVTSYEDALKLYADLEQPNLNDRLAHVEILVHMASSYTRLSNAAEAERRLQEAFRQVSEAKNVSCSDLECENIHRLEIVVNAQLADLYRRQAKYGEAQERYRDVVAVIYRKDDKLFKDDASKDVWGYILSGVATEQRNLSPEFIEAAFIETAKFYAEKGDNAAKSVLERTNAGFATPLSSLVADKVWSYVLSGVATEHPDVTAAFIEAANFYASRGDFNAEVFYWISTQVAWEARELYSMAKMEPLLKAHDDYIALLRRTNRAEEADEIQRNKKRLLSIVEGAENPLP